VLLRDGAVEEAHLAQDPESTARLLRRYFAERTDLHGRETCVVLLLNVRRKAIGIVPISVGCLTSSLVHPREVFGPALTSGAAAIVLSHNHPSGDPEPSPEDLALTRRLAAAGALLGIEVLDHIIVGEHRHVSLHQRGVL
jgi:DNA repair protein RadC